MAYIDLLITAQAGYTPLRAAVMAGSVPAARLLLDAGCDIEVGACCVS